MNVFWLEQTADEVPASDAWLSGTERGRLAGLTVPKRREDWRLGRWTAKRALASYLCLPDDFGTLAAIEVIAAPDGAPEARINGFASPPHISLSHCSSRALCLTGPHGIAAGCDIEAAEPRSAAFLADYFTPLEQSFAAAHPEAPWLPALLWSAKESALKAIREGLRLDTRSVTIRLSGAVEASPEWQPLEAVFADGRVLGGWWRCEDASLRTVVGAAHPPERLLLTGTRSITYPSVR